MSSPQNRRNPVEALADEFMQRRRMGEHPTIEDYAAQYPDLAADIRELFPTLAMLENARSHIGHPSANEPRLRGSTRVGSELADFRILKEIGRGGMGVVYEALQISLGRRVALKVLAEQLVRSSNYLERFHREARAAASLQHASIVPVFGVGMFQGTHYYAMQYIHGRGMDEVLEALQAAENAKSKADAPEKPSRREKRNESCELASALLTGEFVPLHTDADTTCVHSDQDRLRQQSARSFPAVPNSRTMIAHENTTIGAMEDTSPASISQLSQAQHYVDRIAKLGVQVADALEFAHERGILHRDIKPSNLLFDLHGHVWVTDFGLAKVEGEEDLTKPGDILGTLRYLAPESVKGKHDVSSDVYGLGLTLYELLAKQRAFSTNDQHSLIRQICEHGPPPLTTIARGIPADLATVIHKAIAIEPSQRYRSAAELRNDLQRFVDGEPVRARRISWLERGARRARRNPGLTSMFILTLLLLVGGLIGGWVSASRFQALAEQRRLESIDAKRQTIESSVFRAEVGAASGRIGQRVAGLEAIRLSSTIAEEIKIDPAMKRRMRDAAISCLSRTDLEELYRWPTDVQELFAVDIDDEATTCAIVANGVPAIRITRPQTGELMREIEVPTVMRHSVRLSAKGKYVACVRGLFRANVFKPYYRQLLVFDVNTGRQVLNERMSVSINAYQFGKQSDVIAFATPSGQVRVVSLPVSETIHELQTDGMVRCMEFADHDRSLVVSTELGWPVERWEDLAGYFRLQYRRLVEALFQQRIIAAWLTEYRLDERTAKAPIPLPKPALTMAFAPNGVLAIGMPNAVRVVDLELNFTFTEFPVVGMPTKLGFDPHADTLAVGSYDSPDVYFYDARTGDQQLRAPGTMIGFRNDELFLAQARSFIANRFLAPEVIGGLAETDADRRGACHPSQRVFVQPVASGGLVVWDLDRKKPLAIVDERRFSWVVFSPDGKSLYTSSRERINALSDLDRWPFALDQATNRWKLGPPERIELPNNLHPHYLALDGSGRWLAFDDTRTQVIGLYDLLEGQVVRTFPQPYVMTVDISRDGKQIAAGTWDGAQSVLFDAATGNRVKEFETGRSLARFSPDGQFLFCGARAYELPTGRETSEFPESVYTIWYDPLPGIDEAIFFLSSNVDGSTQLLDVRSNTIVGSLQSHRSLERLLGLGMTADRAKFVWTSAGKMHVWNLDVLREELSKLGLDWDVAPSTVAAPGQPMQVDVDLGAWR